MAAEAARRVARQRPDPPPQAVLGLLNYITATSLDEDYAHVSARRAPGSRRRRGRGAMAVLAMFGVLVATAAVQTARTADQSATSRSSLVAQLNARKAELDRLTVRASTLRSQVATGRAQELTDTRAGRALQDQVRRLQVAAGTVRTRGPGIRVVVDDAPGGTSVKQQVQAPDLQKLVNGLWQVGAEAIAVNGQRLTATSAIRDAAGAITVNFRSLRGPYTVSAIGDPDTMAADLLDTDGGQVMVTLQSTFGLVFRVDIEESMVLPAATPVLRGARALEPPQRQSGRGEP
ncbi:MAG: DUF881 domain-containing protein [Nocardioidaceae bacterium]